jgi:hypothetical protein
MSFQAAVTASSTSCGLKGTDAFGDLFNNCNEHQPHLLQPQQELSSHVFSEPQFGQPMSVDGMIPATGHLVQPGHGILGLGCGKQLPAVNQVSIHILTLLLQGLDMLE